MASDLVVPFEIGVAVLLVVGMILVRRGYIRAHMVIQSSMVLVNIPVVLLWMVPVVPYVLPDLAGEGLQPAYFVPTVMLVAGAAAELLGIYILLVAGTNLVRNGPNSAGTRSGCGPNWSCGGRCSSSVS